MDYRQAVLDTLDALDALEVEKEHFMASYKERKKQFEEDLKRYRAQARKEDE